ncbi:hypothetical protein BX600DRAFT_308396 [Xylariales sp. PMI_506]|nr:hypothetical protein BX600DRAFT_308396 [Xylariales sp. PMI_506]
MEPPPMILPKGIVFNSDRVYKEVASYPLVPPEKIYEYWHVYTTTFGKLKDPTASRLENFWWHVLGSDRRYLSGPTLARIFEDISNGPTFVKLRGPPNRYEGPSPPATPIVQNAIVSLGAGIADGRTQNEGKLEKTEAARPIQPSSSKPPPSHPILKKPRGPSSSGPRPTARFVSPPESEAEDSHKESEIASSASVPTTPVLEIAESKNFNGATAKDKHKRSSGSAAKKKSPAFVASSASKRRPAMPRRQSSQSSGGGGSEVGSREGSSSLSSRFLGSQRSVSPIAERPGQWASTMVDEGDKPSLSAKAVGKRPAARITPATSMVSAQPVTSPGLPASTEAGSFGSRQQRTLSSGNGKESTHETVTSARWQNELPRPRTGQSDVEELTPADISTPQMIRSRSDIGGSRINVREQSGRRVPPQGLLSTSTATTSTIAAQGTIIEFDENTPARTVTNALSSKMETPEFGGPKRSGSAVTLTPTAPSNTPSVPLGRSKSQLTLLLERQNEKKPRR